MIIYHDNLIRQNSLTFCTFVLLCTSYRNRKSKRCLSLDPSRDPSSDPSRDPSSDPSRDPSRTLSAAFRLRLYSAVDLTRFPSYTTGSDIGMSRSSVRDAQRRMQEIITAEDSTPTEDSNVSNGGLSFVAGMSMVEQFHIVCQHLMDAATATKSWPTSYKFPDPDPFHEAVWHKLTATIRTSSTGLMSDWNENVQCLVQNAVNMRIVKCRANYGHCHLCGRECNGLSGFAIDIQGNTRTRAHAHTRTHTHRRYVHRHAQRCQHV